MYQDTVNAGQRDFLSVELRGGEPRLRVDLGSGPISADGLEIPNGKRLDDGEWHTIEIFKEGMVREPTVPPRSLKKNSVFVLPDDVGGAVPVCLM